MFTVLIKYVKSRREVLIPARSVEFSPAGESGEGLLINHGVEAEGGSHLGFTKGENEDRCDENEDWRDVFVMNANGKTVARYTL